MSVSKRLRDTKFLPDEEGWVVFVKDHLRYLKKKATIMHIPITTSSTYNYRPLNLFNHLKIHPSIHWIILWLNELSTETFVDITQLYFVEVEEVNRLRQMYDSFKTKVQAI